MDTPYLLFALIAFLGGAVSLLSPCSAFLIPAFFTYSFKQRERLVFATAIFFLGLSTIFIPLSLGVGFLTSFLQSYRIEFFQIAGLLLILFGILSVFGKTPHAPTGVLKGGEEKRGGLFTIYILGIFFGATGSCVGPILGAIITLAAATGASVKAVSLLWIYALGLTFPLFLLALSWERFRLYESRFVRGRLFALNVFGRLFYFHSTNLIVGLLFIVLGIIFIQTRGTVALFAPFRELGILEVFFYLQERIFGIGH